MHILLLVRALQIVQNRSRYPERGYDAQLEEPRASLAYAIGSGESISESVLWAKHALHALEVILGPQQKSPTRPFSARRVAEAILAGIDLRDDPRLVAARIIPVDHVDADQDDALRAAGGYILDYIGGAAASTNAA